MRNHLQTTALLVLLTASLHAQQPPSIWQGSYTAANEQHRVVLELTPSLQAKTLAIEFVPYTLHIDSSTIINEHLHIATDDGKGLYEATLSDADTLRGTWTWDKHTTPLELHRVPKDAAWAQPFQYQYHHLNVTYARPKPDEPKIAFTPRLAVDYMEAGAIAWTAERGCVACHTNGSYMVVRPMMTSQLGPPQKEIRDAFLATLHEALAVPPGELQTDVEAPQIVYVAAGLAIWDANVLHHLSPETAQAIDLMFRLQRPTGDWFIGDDNNPPLESNTWQLATVAARAVANAPGWLAQQRGTPLEAHVNLLKRFLREPHAMQGDYDRVDLLWTASEYSGLLDARQKQEIIDMIFAHQQIDGGWSIRAFARPEEWGKGNRAEKLRAEVDFGFPQSDGHMTGLAIIALRKAGVPETDPRIQQGVKWLLTNQRSSGRWWTRSLNRDGWQFIIYSGTAYPLLALSLCHKL